MVRDFFSGFLSLTISAPAAEVYLPPNFIGGLRSCCRVALSLRYHLAGFFGILLVPKGPLVSRGFKILGGTASRLRSMSWGVFYLNSCLLIQK